MRGRVFGLLNTLSAGLTPVSMLLSGAISDLINDNVILIYGFNSVLLIATSLWLITNPKVKGFLSGMSSQ